MRDAAGSGKEQPKKGDAVDEAAAALTKAQQEADTHRRNAEAANATAAAERARADENARIAQDAQAREQAAREQARGGMAAQIDSDIATATREIEVAEQELIRANEAGEFAKAAKAQRELARASAKLDRREADKIAFEANAGKTQAHEGRVEAPRHTDPFEGYLASNNFTLAAQTWLRAHRDCAPAAVGGDPVKNAKMMAGHYDALAKNLPMNSAEYFKTIEDHLGGQQMSSAAETVEAGAEQRQQQPKPRQKAPPTAAPPSREVPAADGSPGQQERIKLNALMQETALFSYPQNPGETEQAWRKRAFGTYASEYVKAKAEGKIGRLTH